MADFAKGINIKEKTFDNGNSIINISINVEQIFENIRVSRSRKYRRNGCKHYRNRKKHTKKSRFKKAHPFFLPLYV